jgi:hypothetical protein
MTMIMTKKMCWAWVLLLSMCWGAFGQDSIEPNTVKGNLQLTNMRYVELHGGIAVIDLGAEAKFPFPGLSGLVGFRAGKRLFADCQVGLALPSLGTAKVGLGYISPKPRGLSFTAGCRFWPNHVFVQLGFKSEESLARNVRDGEWFESFISFELSQWVIDQWRHQGPTYLLYDSEERSFYSRFILSFGIRKYLKK